MLLCVFRFEPLHIQVKGLTTTVADPNVHQVWRLVSRRLLREAGFATAMIQCLHKDWVNIAPTDDDAVLLVKERMRDTVLGNQDPLLVMPAAEAAELNIADLKILPPNDLGDRFRSEFRRTATALQAEPWKLFKAQKYLEDLCLQNWEASLDPEAFIAKAGPAQFPFLASYRAPDVNPLGGGKLFFQDALPMPPPRPIEVISPAPGPRLKQRPAAATIMERQLKKRPAAATIMQRPAAAKRPAAAAAAAVPVVEPAAVAEPAGGPAAAFVFEEGKEPVGGMDVEAEVEEGAHHVAAVGPAVGDDDPEVADEVGMDARLILSGCSKCRKSPKVRALKELTIKNS